MAPAHQLLAPRAVPRLPCPAEPAFRAEAAPADAASVTALAAAASAAAPPQGPRLVISKPGRKWGPTTQEAPQPAATASSTSALESAAPPAAPTPPRPSTSARQPPVPEVDPEKQRLATSLFGGGGGAGGSVRRPAAARAAKPAAASPLKASAAPPGASAEPSAQLGGLDLLLDVGAPASTEQPTDPLAAFGSLQSHTASSGTASLDALFGTAPAAPPQGGGGLLDLDMLSGVWEQLRACCECFKLSSHAGGDTFHVTALLQGSACPACWASHRRAPRRRAARRSAWARRDRQVLWRRFPRRRRQTPLLTCWVDGLVGPCSNGRAVPSKPLPKGIGSAGSRPWADRKHILASAHDSTRVQTVQ